MQWVSKRYPGQMLEISSIRLSEAQPESDLRL